MVSDNLLKKKLTLWIYSNLVSSPDPETNEKQIAKFLADAPVQGIVAVSAYSNELDHKKEADWVICNIINYGTKE